MLVAAVIPEFAYERQYKGGGTHTDGAHTYLIFNLSSCHPLLLPQDVILCGKLLLKKLSAGTFSVSDDDDRVVCSASQKRSRNLSPACFPTSYTHCKPTDKSDQVLKFTS
jgi:hypothetical protein